MGASFRPPELKSSAVEHLWGIVRSAQLRSGAPVGCRLETVFGERA